MGEEVLTWRDRIADWLTNGELTRAKEKAARAERARSDIALKYSLEKYFRTLRRMNDAEAKRE